MYKYAMLMIFMMGACGDLTDPEENPIHYTEPEFSWKKATLSFDKSDPVLIDDGQLGTAYLDASIAIEGQAYLSFQQKRQPFWASVNGSIVRVKSIKGSIGDLTISTRGKVIGCAVGEQAGISSLNDGEMTVKLLEKLVSSDCGETSDIDYCVVFPDGSAQYVSELQTSEDESSTYVWGYKNGKYSYDRCDDYIEDYNVAPYSSIEGFFDPKAYDRRLLTTEYVEGWQQSDTTPSGVHVFLEDGKGKQKEDTFIEVDLPINTSVDVVKASANRGRFAVAFTFESTLYLYSGKLLKMDWNPDHRLEGIAVSGSSLFVFYHLWGEGRDGTAKLYAIRLDYSE